MDNYSSDISQSLFAIISPILEPLCKTTSARNVNLYDGFCITIYVLKRWCQLRMTPRDYSNRSTYCF